MILCIPGCPNPFGQRINWTIQFEFEKLKYVNTSQDLLQIHDDDNGALANSTVACSCLQLLAVAVNMEL